MTREIIVPAENKVTLQLPDEMVGKEVEIIAFELEKAPSTGAPASLKNIQEIFEGCRVDLSGFVFNRDEANDYD